MLALLKENGKTEKDIVKHLGIGNGAFTHWKYENQKSFHQHIRTMVEYLDVTSNYLLYVRDEEVNRDTLSASEIRLVKLYRQMGIGQKECLIHTADWFINALDGKKIHKKYNLAVKTGEDFVVEIENTRKNHFLRGDFKIIYGTI